MSPSSLTFHPFPRLPEEIRLEIWALAMPGPRTVTICITPRKDLANDTTESSDSPSVPQWEERCGSAPVLLHVCRESRNYFLHTSHYGPHFGDAQRAPIYFDLEIDTLDVEFGIEVLSRWIWHRGHAENPLDNIMKRFSSVKHMMLDDDSPFFDRPSSLGQCGNLQYLTIKTDGAEYYWLGEGTDDEDRKQDPDTLGSSDHISWFTWFRREEVAGVEIALDEVAEMRPEWKRPEVRWRSFRVLRLIAAGDSKDDQNMWML